MTRARAVLAAVVLLVASGCGADAPDRQVSAAQSFVTLAEGGADEVPWADSVGYSISGKSVATLTPDGDRAADLSACLPDATEVEGRPCPFSPLKTIAALDGDPTVENALPERVGCNTVTAPDAPVGATPTVIRPPEKERDCFSDFAVTLFEDDAGEVVWIDLTLSGP